MNYLLLPIAIVASLCSLVIEFGGRLAIGCGSLLFFLEHYLKNLLSFLWKQLGLATLVLLKQHSLAITGIA